VSGVRSRDDQRSAILAWESVPGPTRPILRELVLDGARSRTALARKLGLSTGSLTRLTKPLLEAGLIAERDVLHDPVNGRPTRPLEIVAGNLHFLGVKIAAGHLYAVLTDLRANVVAQQDTPLPDMRSEAVLREVYRLADLLTAGGALPVAAGVALGGDGRSPAPVGEHELVDSAILDWEQVPLRRLVTERLGVPCVVSNDVTALACLHQYFGDAQGVPDFAVLAVGAGIGYALVVHGEPMRITEADVTEFVHQMVDPGGPMCPGGHRGCLAAYVASHSVVMTAAQGMRRFSATYPEVLRLATEGNPVCAHAVEQAAWAMGVTIANIANTAVVKRVIVAGEGADIVDIARPHLERGIATRRRDPHAVNVTNMPHDFRQWARGAAVVAIRDHVSVM
jgi:predicted NBD/HSP70 family sugar kinase